MHMTFHAALLASVLLSAPTGLRMRASRSTSSRLAARRTRFQLPMSCSSTCWPTSMRRSRRSPSMSATSRECSDENLQNIYDYFMSVKAPIFYTSSDNEWIDYHRRKAGEYDPEERLEKSARCSSPPR